MKHLADGLIKAASIVHCQCSSLRLCSVLTSQIIHLVLGNFEFEVSGKRRCWLRKKWQRVPLKWEKLSLFFVFLSHLTERHKSWKTQVEQSPTYSPTLKDAAPLVTIRLSYESEGGVLISTKKNRNKKDSRVCRVSINHNYKLLHHTTLRGLFTHRCGKHVRLHNLLWHFFS